MRRVLLTLLVTVLAGAPALAVPFWGARESSPAETPPMSLKPGEFVWAPALAPEGPMVVVVSLDEQRAYAYRNGVEIGYTTVSTGKPGHETPTGIFTILQKDKDHHSSTYNDAAMPYQERLTWDGVALHAGGLPGYPESHGCVHLPSQFAADLFGVSHMGMTVVIVDSKTAPADVDHPAALAPVDVSTGTDDIEAGLQAGDKWRWEPEKSPEGPVSIMMSSADQQVIVIRNGVEIGRARVTFSEPDKPVGTHAFIVKAGVGSGESVIEKGAAARDWMAVPMPGYADSAGTDLSSVVGGRVRMPQDFAGQVYPLLVPGTTLLVTDAPVLEENSGKQMTVIGSGNPNVG
ncbi:MAG: L,D-transpeptidase [Steroidobacteraceae bacterium]|nr:L,D-transpeptidase [Steroidobacteraceae bacterium]